MCKNCLSQACWSLESSPVSSTLSRTWGIFFLRCRVLEGKTNATHDLGMLQKLTKRGWGIPFHSDRPPDRPPDPPTDRPTGPVSWPPGLVKNRSPFFLGFAVAEILCCLRWLPDRHEALSPSPRLPKLLAQVRNGLRPLGWLATADSVLFLWNPWKGNLGV